MNIKYRMQDWAAARFNAVQYPQIKRIHDDAAPQLNFGQALSLLVIGCVCVVIGLITLAFLAFFFFPALFL